MKFAVDPWDPGYGSATDAEMTDSEADVVLDLEVEPSDWAPVSTVGVAAPDAVVFVDGVRRLEARAWVSESDGTAVAGIFASYAAGTVCCDATRARIGDTIVGRGIYSPAEALADVVTRHGVFRARTARDTAMESLTFAVHDQMAEAEVQVAELARRGGNELILLDGPIRKRGHIPEAVGLIKSHHRRYLPPELDAVVARLGPGERTPLFRIDAPPFGRTSWYARLPGEAPVPYASVLRCEASGALPTETLVALADRVTAAVTRFASHAHKDTRAPQNLYPIGGLERELRRRLGDQYLLYRALRQAAAAA